MNRITKATTLCLGVIWALTGAPARSAEVVGWNNDGSADFPDANPPVQFNGASGFNLRWKARMPNWGNSSPIVVVPAEGGPSFAEATEGRPALVLCVSEPDEDYAPLLMCFEADTGKERWRVRLDAVPLLPLSDAEKEEVRALAMKNSKRLRVVKRLKVEADLLLAKHKEVLSKLDKDAAVPEEIRTVFEPLITQAREHEVLNLKVGEKVELRTFTKQLHSLKEFSGERRLASLALCPSVWEGSPGTWEGVAYPTPVSDGKYVYTMTAHNLYSCHDLKGTVAWQKRFPLPSKADLRLVDEARIQRFGQKQELGGNWGGWSTEHFQTSPILYAGKLIASGGRILRCFDAATGALLWHVPMAGAMRHTMGVPAVVDVQGTACVIMVCDTWNTAANEIVRLKDGLVIGEIPGTRWAFNGSIPVLSDGTILRNVPVEGHGENYALVGFRLNLEADGKVTARELWRIPPRGIKGHDGRGAWRGTRYYGSGGVCLEGSTGGVLFGGLRDGYQRAAHDGQALLAGPWYVQCSFASGGFSFWDADTGALIAGSTVPVNPQDGRSPGEVGAQAYRPDWQWLGPATPFAWRDRFYVRANEFLYCFAPAVNGTLQDDTKVVASIRSATTPAEVTQHLAHDSAQYRYEAVKRLAALGKAGDARASLEKLARSDPHLEIRAEALEALGLGKEEPGMQLLRVLMVEVGAKPWQHRSPSDSPLRELGLVMRFIGEVAGPAIERVLAAGAPKAQQTAAALVLYGDVPRTEAARDALIPLFSGRAIDVDLLSSALVRWPADAAVAAAFTAAFTDARYGGVQQRLFYYLLPFQAGPKRREFLVTVAGANASHPARNDAIAALVAAGAVAEIRPLMAAAKGRIPAEIANGLAQACADHKDPAVRGAAVDIIATHLNQDDKNCQMGMVSVLGRFGAAAAPALPAIKAIVPGEDKKLKDACDQAVAAIEKAAAEKK